MSAAHAIRLHIEAALAGRIPAALSPAPRSVRAGVRVGIPEVDALVPQGLPRGAITEIVGAECSGRTSLALSFIAGRTEAGSVCAWVDVSDAFHPESAAAAGVDLAHLLWVRCGKVRIEKPTAQNGFALQTKYFHPQPAKKGLHGGGFGPHPRTESNGLSEAVSHLLQPGMIAARCAEPQRRPAKEKVTFDPVCVPTAPKKPASSTKPWSRLEQALRATDLLLQAGGFAAIVLDMGSIAPEHALRVPLATWFRYRAAAERTQASVMLLSQHACAKSSAGLVLQLHPSAVLDVETTVFAGMEHRVELVRERNAMDVDGKRKPPQTQGTAKWQNRTSWTVSR
ncbi:MAG: hypothetical protein NVS9B15_02150 [Acidobacteriaceae bacterium]